MGLCSHCVSKNPALFINVHLHPMGSVPSLTVQTGPKSFFPLFYYQREEKKL